MEQKSQKGINPYLQYMYSYPHKTAYGSLEGVRLSGYMKYLSGKENSLYIHLPFCQYKCGYCNLFSIAGTNPDWMEAYVSQMERQVAQLAELLPDPVSFRDLTLGGGTPLLLESSLLRRVFRLADSFSFDRQAGSVIVETSPNQTTAEKLELLRENGTKRLSIGVQSFQEEELDTLGRRHSARAAHKALQQIGRAGFETVNIDIIYGIPGQTWESLLDSLGQAVSYQPEELFVYPLYVKPGTGLYKAGVRTAPEAFDLYQIAKAYLQAQGYVRQSMRRFVRQGQTVEREYRLCGFSNTLSIGCGGRSYMGNFHFCTPYTVGQKACKEQIARYLEQTDFRTVHHGYLLNPDEMRRRYAVKHLLYGRGICREDYRIHFQGEAEQDFPMLLEWERERYVQISEEFISLTEEGMDLSDYLGPQFISEEVAANMRRWERG